MSTNIRRIAVLVDSSRAFDRGLIHGISTFAASRPDWQLYYHERTLRADLEDWLHSWKRIEYLLIHSDLTLKDIARQTGFSSEVGLSNFFKAHSRQTPGDFRRAHRPALQGI